MTDRPTVTNDISGQVHGPVVQAGSITELHVDHHPIIAVPAQLPGAPSAIIGRSAELHRIELAFGEGMSPRIAILTGPGGIGKTAVALHHCHSACDQYPDGQLYANLRGFDGSSAPVQPGEVLSGFLRAFGVEPRQIPASLAERAAMFRSLTFSRHVLVMLDNAATSAQVEALLPSGKQAATVITSRSPLGDLVTMGAASIQLGYLDRASATNLLASRLGADRVAEESASAAELVGYCAGLPLALSIVAARAAMRPGFGLQAIADELRDESERLEQLNVGVASQTLTNVFSWSYRRLSEHARSLFRHVALNTGPDIGLPTAVWLVNAPTATGRALLRELVDMNLLEEYRPRRYRLHDLLRMYAIALLQKTDSPAEQRQALAKLMQYYLLTGFVATNRLVGEAPLVNSPVRPIMQLSDVPQKVLRSLRTREEALAWYDAEDANLLAAISQANAQEVDDYWFHLPLVVDNAWVWRGRLDDVLEVWRQTADLAQRREQTEALAHASRFLGMAHMRFGDNASAIACLRRSTAAYKTIGDVVGEASARLNLSGAEHRQGDNENALSDVTTALQTFEEIGFRPGTAHSLNLLASIRSNLGAYDDALTLCRRAVTIFEYLGDENGAGDAHDYTGIVQRKAGRYTEAIISFQLAITLYQRTGDAFGEGDATGNLADAMAASGDITAAKVVYRKAITLFNRQGRTHKESACRVELRRLGVGPE